ncbi:MAG: hypothetical protein JSW54_07485 [Fidelibacterota bacterium]|nr:MAG: hypothetical protein JSW54_07485 [Candidatus Neomarinimicrobiota bacterium]
MSRESRVIISRLITITIFIAGFLAMVVSNFLITLIIISAGLIIWLLYLLAADLGTSPGETTSETSLGMSLSRVIAGLGGILAISAFRTYGVEQTMFGDYAFNLIGLALALAVLLVMLMPLFVVSLTSKSRPAVTPTEEKPVPPEAAAATGPPAAPAQQPPLYYTAPYPPDYEPYTEADELDYEEEEEDWEAGEEKEPYEDYYEEEYEDEEESEEDEYREE